MPVIGLVDACEPACGFWELTLSSQGEQPVYLTTGALLSLAAFLHNTGPLLHSGLSPPTSIINQDNAPQVFLQVSVMWVFLN